MIDDPTSRPARDRLPGGDKDPRCARYLFGPPARCGLEAGHRGPCARPSLVIPKDLPAAPPCRPRFRDSDVGGAFDGFTVSSDADPGL